MNPGYILVTIMDVQYIASYFADVQDEALLDFPVCQRSDLRHMRSFRLPQRASDNAKGVFGRPRELRLLRYLQDKGT